MNKSTSLAILAIAGVIGAVACGSSSTAASGASSSSGTFSTSSGTSTGSSSSSSGTTTSTSSGTVSTSSGTASSSSGGLGSMLVCPSTTADGGTGKNAFDTYGATAFLAVNELIFANVNAELADAGSTNLGTSFSLVGTAGHDDLNTFKGQLAALLVYTYGGPTTITFDGGTFEGDNQDLEAEHTGLNITQDQYNYFISDIIVPALVTAGVPQADITQCFAPVVMLPAVEKAVIGH